MTLRDRTLIAALAVAFVVMSGLAIAPSFVPAGATFSPRPSLAAERRYVEGVLGHATNISPFGARSSVDRDITALVFRGLVRLGPDDTVVGDLASSWEVDPSGSRWTFHLRPGMQWQDGAPLTSGDVVFTIDALSDPAYSGPSAASWSEVRAVAQDALTVTLTLATPLGGFLQAATQAIAPAHLLSQTPPADLATSPFGHAPVGSGPFRLATIDDRGAILEAADPSPAPGAVGASPAATARSSGAFPRPYLNGIEFRFFDDEATLTAAWDAGELDGASMLSPASAAALGATPGARLVHYPSSTTLVVVLNLRAGQTTFADTRVRKALLEAVDRDALVAQPLYGFGSVASSLIPTWAPEFSATSSPVLPYDPAAARADLAAAGWKVGATSWTPKGAKAPLVVTVMSADATSNPIAFTVAEQVAVAWRAIGLAVTHQSVPAADLLPKHLESGDFQAAVVPLVIGLDPDLYPLLASSQTRTGGANLSGVQDPSLDNLLVAARAPGSTEQRLAAYAALQQRLSSQLYVLPLVFREEVVVLRGTLQGPAPRPVGGPGDRFWDVLTWRLADSPTGG
ncbi:MAG TPA: peptide ABC transporter substrate-binding protein [Candidatus Limnocylindrales bacterium]|nr:peptide ABC transporter substrate-binding protein [Candidatus Limnocylindrales bacterium]